MGESGVRRRLVMRWNGRSSMRNRRDLWIRSELC